MLVSDLCTDFTNRRQSGGLFLLPAEVEACCIKAVRFYTAYGYLKTPPAAWVVTSAIWANVGSTSTWATQFDKLASGNGDMALLTNAIDLTPSEWAIIMPLFEAYVEKESALRLEASRGLGADVYGQSVSEVDQKISQLEAELPQKAFQEDAWTVGDYPLDTWVP